MPGFAGVRSPKWLASITVRDHPSDNLIQQKMYKLFPQDAIKPTADWSKATTIDDIPLNSAICEPAPHARLQAGANTIRRYAIATARSIARVELSVDGGKTWRQAEVERHPDTPWSWTFWSTQVDLDGGDHEMVVLVDEI